ncbi:MAG: hypothetical protein F4246_03155 [Rhodothermaceae bacterium]|nr:hypothetical protein [Rhodothermaceae bacterium]MYD55996.1 hypothetical protein [Rhodothermaceae bacterium]MYJ56159.1 hypothetical protein [Rhodothermaceae bacterium]
MRYLVLTLALLGAGCAASTPIVLPLAPDKPILPGVDSVHVQKAWELAAESFARDAARAARLSEEAHRLAQLADSLLGPAPVAQSRDTVKALEAFNAGADALNRMSEADSLQALELLQEAAEKFEQALDADAFDDGASRWLARVYETLAERFRREDAIQDQLRILHRLVARNQDRHDYIALLAAAQEQQQTKEAGIAAGALWERAALVLLDDVDIGLIQVPDSAVLFAYHIRASRAFVQSDHSLLAQESLNRARSWQRTAEERALVHADSVWLAWDESNLSARKRFDVLLNEVADNSGAAVEGLTALLADVRERDARIDVRHQLALARYASGAEELAAASMQDLVAEAPGRQALVDDYAVMSYNLAQTLRQAGDLERALAYLLQSASLNAPIAARAAFDASILLRNNLDAAIKYALMAEARLDALGASERNALTRYLAELYRRSGDRERAKVYIDRLHASQGN